MGDSLTQLQDCLDQLATQMFASVNYINAYHENAPIRGQEWRAKWPNTLGTVDGTSETGHIDGMKPNTNSAPGTPADESDAQRPDSPSTFNAALRELSKDLVMKEQQIEYLIKSLPGIGTSQVAQEVRIKDLESELKSVEAEVAKATETKAHLLQQVDNTIEQVRRI